MKRNFEKKLKNIARAYSKENKEFAIVTFASHTFDNEVIDFI